MWGTLSLGNTARKINRFIPTHVGNTVDLPKNSRALSVHPHACGEHYRSKDYDCEINGSSPRMWGTQTSYDDIRLSFRFIPTHVGNT